MTALPFYLVFLTPLLVGLGALAGGPAVLLAVLFVFGLLPVLDERVGALGSVAALPRADRRRADLPLWLWVPTAVAVTAGALAWALAPGRSLAEAAGLLFSLGVMNGAGINVAHELMHRRGRAERAAAEVLMTLVSYPHFCVEHVHGHHRHVATPADPATSRRGETLYAFLPRTVLGGLRSAWRLEGERIARAGLRAGSLADRRLRHPLLLALAYGLVGTVGGLPAVLAFAAQGLVAIFLLEAVNYLEHYGLRRREVAPGQYEAVKPEHSWNSGHRVSNWYLFNLARHSDHHWQASRPYDQLRPQPEAPQLPTGYSGMLLLTLVPRLWFRVMDPRVDAWTRTRESSAA